MNVSRTELLAKRQREQLDAETVDRIEAARRRRDDAEVARLQRARLANALEGFRVSR